MKNKKATVNGHPAVHHYEDDVSDYGFGRADTAIATTYHKKDGLNHKFVVVCTWNNEVMICKTLTEAKILRERMIFSAGGATSVYIAETLESTEVY